MRIQYEHDVVACRQRARQVAEALGFEKQQQTRLATAVSEIARNAFMYAGGGRAEFFLEGETAPQLLTIHVIDEGRGIDHLEDILEGRFRSETGMGLGLVGAKRLMDTFAVKTATGAGTEVILGKLLSRRSSLITAPMVPKLMAEIERETPKSLLDEFREQNGELMRTLDELRRRQDELLNLNRELEDTNRGVVALYAELDEKADHLRRADDLKSRFLSNVSHEFRTPLSSILALSRLLGDRTDGDLSSEQEIQVKYIRKSAETLFELVNDLLDLAKVEAGKIVVRPVEFQVKDLFGALRGMLRPLLISSALDLNFEDADDCPPVFSDEGKVSQILRNFISNALKFTEAGEVRVSVECDPDEKFIAFEVRDTGIGIPAEHKETIFQDFSQLDSPLQRKVKGTGLGLPLSRKLAELLGGSVSVESEVGVGSVFSVGIPRIYQQAEPLSLPDAPETHDASRATVLLVEDQFEVRLLYGKYLQDSPWQIISARSIREAENVLRSLKPVAIVLDILLQGEDTWTFLARLKSDRATRDIPILVATEVEDRAKAISLGANAFVRKPVDREQLLQSLRQLTCQAAERTVLLADDEEVSRYLWKQLFRGKSVHFAEAANGVEALALAKSQKLDLVVMDLNMPEMDGYEAIRKMQTDPALKQIPVIVWTSSRLADERVRGIAGTVLAIVTKESLSQRAGRDRIENVLRSAGLEDLIGAAEGGAIPVVT